MHTRLLVAVAAALLGAAGCSGDQEKGQDWNRGGAESPRASINYFAPDGGANKETAQAQAWDVLPPAESSDLAPDAGAPQSVSQESSAQETSGEAKKSITEASQESDEQASAPRPIVEDAQEERSNRTGAYLAAGIGVAALLAFLGGSRRRDDI